MLSDHADHVIEPSIRDIAITDWRRSDTIRAIGPDPDALLDYYLPVAWRFFVAPRVGRDSRRQWVAIEDGTPPRRMR